MTDYLELTWPGQEDALLEQARRLERALSRLIAGGQPKPEGPGEESRSRARERPAGARTEGAGEAEAELLSPDGSRRRTPGPQLERMDLDAPGTGRAGTSLRGVKAGIGSRLIRGGYLYEADSKGSHPRAG